MSKSLLNLTGSLVLVGVLLLLLFGWLNRISAGVEAEGRSRRTFEIVPPADRFPELERPLVDFDHERHTSALPDEECTRCHGSREDGSLVYRLTDTMAGATASEIVDAYHDQCVSCHEERGGGPVACGECHVKAKSYVNAPWHSMELDLRQHDRHVKFAEEKCDRCHHSYDEERGELVYREGEERSCRDCHRHEEAEEAPSLRTVAHRDCVGCHLEQKAAGADAGPIDCEGCHDPALAEPPIMDMRDVPRLDRGQEDVPFLLVADNKMKGVPFNHINHERVTRNCRTCHHESLEKCSSCHTLDGDPRGAGVRLADVYHRADVVHSCVGCHERKKREQSCWVCHVSMEPGPSEATCDVCHTGSPDPDQPARRERDPVTLLPDDLEEKISIGTIADRFQPVEFPHREIVSSLNLMLGDDRLANIFHGDRAVVCTACHHHGPVGDPPPPCTRCHQQPFDPRALGRPGLMGAYHQQCIGCHEELRVLGDYRKCDACHKDDAPMPGRPAGGGGGR